MGSWGFVLLAYGIVWCAILLYFLMLKSRMRRAGSRLAQLDSKGGTLRDAR
jgi:CcmD family protein